MDKYRVLKVLGSGSSGTVSLVAEKGPGASGQRRDGNLYVIKQICFSDATAEGKQRVQREVAVLRSIDHPNIVLYRSSFIAGGNCHLVMEYCEGVLSQVIAERREKKLGPFPATVIVEWMVEMLCAVQYLHSRRIIHRDIKSDNTFLSKKNHIKLGDFGVCKVLSNHTLVAKSLIGTPHYFAPEVCENEEGYDEKSDIWSLGVVFYEICALELPFQGTNILAVVRDITEGEVPPLPEGLDRRFSKIINMMLVRDPTQRPSAQQVLQKYLVLPSSHPSHPSHSPSVGRSIQEKDGPLLVAAGGAPSGGEVAQRAQQRPKSPMKSRAMQAPFARQSAQRRSASENSVMVIPVGGAASPPHKNRAAVHGRGLQPTSSLLHTTVNNSFSACAVPGRELSHEEHHESLQRIKNAKSKIDVQALRRSMKAKEQCDSEVSGLYEEGGDDTPTQAVASASPARFEDEGEGIQVDVYVPRSVQPNHQPVSVGTAHQQRPPSGAAALAPVADHADPLDTDRLAERSLSRGETTPPPRPRAAAADRRGTPPAKAEDVPAAAAKPSASLSSGARTASTADTQMSAPSSSTDNNMTSPTRAPGGGGGSPAPRRGAALLRAMLHRYGSGFAIEDIDEMMGVLYSFRASRLHHHNGAAAGVGLGETGGSFGSVSTTSSPNRSTRQSEE